MRERIEQEEIFKNEVEAARAKAKANVYALREAEKDALQAKHDKVWSCLNCWNYNSSWV